MIINHVGFIVFQSWPLLWNESSRELLCSSELHGRLREGWLCCDICCFQALFATVLEHTIHKYLLEHSNNRYYNRLHTMLSYYVFFNCSASEETLIDLLSYSDPLKVT